MDVAFGIADNLDAKSVAKLSQVWRPMASALQSGQATLEHLKAQCYRAGLSLGSRSTRFLQQPLNTIPDYIQAFVARRSTLRWARAIYAALDVVSPAIPWHDQKARVNAGFMGESGGCFYTVERPGGYKTATKIKIFQPGSDRTGREYRVHSFSFPEVVFDIVIDLEEDIFAVATNPYHDDFEDYNEKDFYATHISVQSLSSTSKLKVEGICKFRCKRPVQVSIKGQYVVALLRSESLHIVDWKEGSGKNIHLGSDARELSYMFTDQHTLLVSEYGVLSPHHPHVQGARLAIRNLKDRTSFLIPFEFLTRFYESGRLPCGVLFIPTVSPHTSEQIRFSAGFFDDPDQRTIGFRILFEKKPYADAREIIVVGNLSTLFEQRQGFWRELNISGKDYKFCGQRLFWTTTGGNVHNMQMLDFNSETSKTFLGNHRSTRVANEKDPSWKTQLSRMDRLCTSHDMGSAMHVSCPPLQDVVGSSMSEDCLFVVRVCLFLFELEPGISMSLFSGAVPSVDPSRALFVFITSEESTVPR